MGDVLPVDLIVKSSESWLKRLVLSASASDFCRADAMTVASACADAEGPANCVDQPEGFQVAVIKCNSACMTLCWGVIGRDRVAQPQYRPPWTGGNDELFTLVYVLV